MKYKLRKDLKLEISPGITLYRIERIRGGELGGYIQSEYNLSQVDDAWVSNNACVYGKARVFGDALVFGDSKVYENALVYGNARIFGAAEARGNAKVYENAQIYGNALVFGNAQISGNVRVCGNAQIYGSARVLSNAFICDDAKICGDAQVCGDAWIRKQAQISAKNHIVNFVLPSQFSITITPDNTVIGCQVKNRAEWLKVTEKEAIKMGLPKELYPHYRCLVKAGMRLVPSRKAINRSKGKKTM